MAALEEGRQCENTSWLIIFIFQSSGMDVWGILQGENFHTQV